MRKFVAAEANFAQLVEASCLWLQSDEDALQRGLIKQGASGILQLMLAAWTEAAEVQQTKCMTQDFFGICSTTFLTSNSLAA